MFMKVVKFKYTVQILSDLLLKDFREDLSTQSAMIKITAEKFTRLFSSI